MCEPPPSAGITSIIKITQLPSISNSTFTESTTQLVILAAAESAITIIAASIPILRALIRDSRPPPGPAQFYHSLGELSVYATGNRGGTNATGTVVMREGINTNSMIVTSASGGSGGSSGQGDRPGSEGSLSAAMAAAWDKETQATYGGSSVGRLSRLSRFSGLSVLVFGGGDRERGTLTSGSERGSDGSRTGSVMVELPASLAAPIPRPMSTPPRRKAVPTRKERVAGESASGHGQEGEGGREQGQGIGRAM